MSLPVSLSLALLVAALAPTTRIQCVQITSLEVPPEVRYGSGAAVLDCEYNLLASELAPGSGLVIKWFWNNSPAPVYQWIPGQRPQDLGMLKGRLDLRYRASDHNATMHRALYITNPTPKLSGEYKCAVSTFWDEDFMIKKMIVYVPEKDLTLMSSRADYETVNVSCRATGVYPEPKLFLYIVAENKTRLLVAGTRVETTARSGEYDIQLEVLLLYCGVCTVGRWWQVAGSRYEGRDDCQVRGVRYTARGVAVILCCLYSRSLVAGTRVETTARSGEYDIQLEVLLLLCCLYSRSLVAGTRVETTARSGEYDIQLEVLLSDTGLDTPTTLCCELRIPETSYHNNSTIVYYPGSTDSISSAMAESGGPPLSPSIAANLLLYYVITLYVHQRV
ncbi:uncharacterized protein LOC128983990 [Macrosteles quadrilineatus]|uniref:uncharacterized protein LOC128983990 n=1 Tax=Macrosteles quadrilineatus TaxID=74068 RepID=UPI0023E1AE60|nr:uncharacterized protein LOC128983990 [Macrosteles quadrilineatus]